MKYIAIDHDSYIEHHGVKGMKWGVRRYQNKDGSFTKAGERRYQKQEARARKKEMRKARNAMMSSYYALEQEFDATDKGKKLKSSFEKWRDTIIDDSLNDKYDPSHQSSYDDAQEKYASAQGAYVYDKLRSKYSDESIRWAIENPIFSFSNKISSDKSTRDAFIEEHVTIKYDNAFD